jgi:hypothetical protein
LGNRIVAVSPDCDFVAVDGDDAMGIAFELVSDSSLAERVAPRIGCDDL